MTSSDFHWVVWLIVLVIGLPMLAIAVWKRGRQARSSFFWRAVICFIAACIITPVRGSENFGGITTTDFIPAVAIFPSALVSMFADRHVSIKDLFEALIISLLLILVVASVLVGVWSAFLRLRKHDEVA